MLQALKVASKYHCELISLFSSDGITHIRCWDVLKVKVLSPSVTWNTHSISSWLNSTKTVWLNYVPLLWPESSVGSIHHLANSYWYLSFFKCNGSIPMNLSKSALAIDNCTSCSLHGTKFEIFPDAGINNNQRAWYQIKNQN